MRTESNSGSKDQRQESLRTLPSVSELIERVQLRAALREAPHSVVRSAAREIVDAYRSKILSNRIAEAPIAVKLEQEVAALVGRRLRSPLEPAINATGILLHTGLGRAPLPEAAARAIGSVARGYAPVELDLESGRRGSRSSIVRRILCELTGAESACVVNNNAAALLLTLSTLAREKEVIVSRGELIEIGGSFRLPAVIESGGAILREVGTTNKTRLKDYTDAIGERTGAVLKVHPSNYRIEGFTQGVGIEELVSVGRANDLPVIHDIGSGLLLRNLHDAIGADEPDARSSIEAGADVVMFSGDKLLGGPQAGIAIGRSELVERMERNPLMRALRVDKLTLAGLGATLCCYRDVDMASREIPMLEMLGATTELLRARAERLAEVARRTGMVARADVREMESQFGGGSIPTRVIPSVGVEIRGIEVGEEELARRLRTGSPPVVARVTAESIWLDLRTVPARQDSELGAALRAAIERSAE